MAEILNLRMARKRAVRAAKEREADANRRAHGMPKRERDLARREAETAAARLDGHRLDPSAAPSRPADERS